MSELPKGWIKVTIGDVLQPQFDGKLIHQGWSPRCHTEAADSDNWGVLKTTAIQDGFFLEEHNKKLPEDKEPRERIEVNSGDLLMTNAGPRARCGITTLVRDVRPKLMLSGKMYRMRFNENYIYPRFIEACLRGEKVRAEIDARKTGMSESGLNLTQARFLTVPFLLAPLNEQIRIANKLDSILAKVDKAQARLDKIPAILKRFRQSVLAAATSGELTKEWRGGKNIETWTFPKIKEVGKVQLGRQRSPKYHSGENMRPYLRVQNVFENLIDISDVMEMNFSEEDFQRYQLHNGDILLNEGQSPKFLGRPAIYRDELEGACFTNTLIRFQANELTIPEFALIVFRNHMHSGRYIEEGTITTNLAHLGAGRFSNVEFPLPPISEQEQIVHSAEKMLNKADKVEQQYLNAKARLDRLTQSILAKAFRGELVPQDPNDEPAEQLLERILKERLSQQQKADKPKKTTKKRTIKTKVADKG